VDLRGHAIEVRINAEDPAGGAFMPSPGPISMLRAPHGFATRWDGGYESGDEISQFYDNLVGKLIVWGRDRDRAIARSLRALRELVIEGVATTIPADLAILAHPDFAALAHSTKWVEDHLDLSGLASAPTAPVSDDVERIRRDIDVEVDGKRFSVSMWVPDTTAAAGRPRRRPGVRGAVGGGSGEVAAPMQGTIVKVLVGPGDIVEAGDAVVVLEAMKMENNVTTDRAGTITEVRVAEGDSVGGGDVVVIVA
jgi:acetyl-CoA/propionyl-CoA carboxylase biotin carboxyl carrier protein